MVADLIRGSARIPAPLDAATMRLVNDRLPVKARSVTLREPA